jgi:hypothetical protein
VILYRNKLIRILECWNEEEPDSQDADLIRRFQQPRPINGMFCRDFYTILIDLHQNESVLLGRIKKDTRYEIRRAAREGFVYELHSGKDPVVFGEFCDFYDEFAAHTGQPIIRRAWLRLLAMSDSLHFSRIAEAGGPTLIWHCYHRTLSRVTLLHSASIFPPGATSAWRTRIGRANRLQHWQDLLHFRDKHLSLYDLGGWYEGKTDQKRLQINRFKEEFGGEIVRNYICEHATTWKGAAFLRLRQLLLGNAI